MGCCERHIKDFEFLRGQDAFNHHPCEELEKKPALQALFCLHPMCSEAYERELIREHCYKEGLEHGSRSPERLSRHVPRPLQGPRRL